MACQHNNIITMLHIQKRGFFNVRYEVTINEEPLCEISKSGFSRVYKFKLNENEYTLKANHIFSSKMSMYCNDELIAEVRQRFKLRSTWEITYKNTSFKLISTGILKREYNLQKENIERYFGSISRASTFSNLWVIDFPESIDTWFQILLFCLSQETETQNAAAT